MSAHVTPVSSSAPARSRTAMPGDRARASARPPSALRLVTQLVREAHGTGIDTSAGALFNHSVWARDRIISSFDLLPERPGVARQTILTVARLQGTRSATLSEEEPGRIHNERRDLTGWRAPLGLKALFALVIAPMWGGSPRGYVTYFAADSTPLFISLVAAYARLRPDILDELVVRRDGSTASIRQAVRDAARWLETHLTPDGLVEVPKHNLLSLPPQIWRDSPTSNFDERGRMANVVEPVAYLDVQALAADALEDAAALDEEDGRPDVLTAEARRLREATQRTFWMDDLAFYAFAADRGAGGRRRVLRARQSDAGRLLATRFFDDMADPDKEPLIGGVVRMLFSPDMLTPAGIRCRALRDHNQAFLNYHEDVWPMDTFMISRGLRLQGFHELADELEARLVDTAAALGGAWEFVVVDDEGRVVDPRIGKAAARLRPGARALPSEMLPEADIGWTATALLRIKRDRATRARAARSARPATAEEPEGAGLAGRDEWIARLTAEILAGISGPSATVTGAARPSGTAAAFPLSRAYLDQAAGLRRAAAVVLVQGFGRVLPLGLARRLGRTLRHQAAGTGRR